MVHFSDHYLLREPSAIRFAGLEFAKRQDGASAINVAIGNVSLPMHGALQVRMRYLGVEGSPFAYGVVKYTETSGTFECRKTFLHLLSCSGFDTTGLSVVVTDGGSQAMELAVLGCTGVTLGVDRPLLVIDPGYSNYRSFAARTGRLVVSVDRGLLSSGVFEVPRIDEIERVIVSFRPSALVVIPYDNPTGQFFSHAQMIELARLCVKYDLWLISDEAYRELFYVPGVTSSVWGITELEVPGILGRRVSIESASKVWNACGLRVGGLITDNLLLHTKVVAEYTANLCANAIGQYIFSALLHESESDLNEWYSSQRTYYSSVMRKLYEGLVSYMPGIIVSRPDSALYLVVDFRVVDPEFDVSAFVLFCAREGFVEVNDVKMTVLCAPMEGFYGSDTGRRLGRTQMRIAAVVDPFLMEMVPVVLSGLLEKFRRKL